MTTHSPRHGGPFDRGSADFYYNRDPSPHYFTGATGQSPKRTDLTPAERAAYFAGWADAERHGDKKDYGQ